MNSDCPSSAAGLRLIALVSILHIWPHLTQGNRVGETWTENSTPFSSGGKVGKNEDLSSSSWSNDMDKNAHSLSLRYALGPTTNDKIPIRNRHGKVIKFNRKGFHDPRRIRYGRRPRNYPSKGRRVPFPRDARYWSTHYKVGTTQTGPYKHFGTVESDVVGETIEEYYRNLANLPDFIRDYQSSYLEPPSPPEESSEEIPNDHFKHFQNYQEDHEHPVDPTQDEDHFPPPSPHYHFENQENHENQDPQIDPALGQWNEKPTTIPNIVIKYSGCKNELQDPLPPPSPPPPSPPPPFIPLPTVDPVLDFIPPFLKIPDFHTVVDIEPIKQEVESSTPFNATLSQNEEDDFEKRFPQIFGEVQNPILTGIGMNGVDLVTPTKSTPLATPVAKDETPIRIPIMTVTTTTPMTTSAMTTTTTVKPFSTTTPRSPRTPLLLDPGDKVVSVKSESSPPLSSLDMSASISTEIHLDESQDEHFKRALLDELIQRLKVMESPRPFLGIPPVRRSSESGDWRIPPPINDRSKELKILKSALRKLLGK